MIIIQFNLIFVILFNLIFTTRFNFIIAILLVLIFKILNMVKEIRQTLKNSIFLYFKNANFKFFLTDKLLNK